MLLFGFLGVELIGLLIDIELADVANVQQPLGL